ncbi:uncharacterized protein VTP21DRAFT_84 [Calcarisporiella thermophila]|uniref:uncharacterized protein n=1 Tax=Calcarisporiella thermophila TaxID=911321 RepID=UPI003744914A
MGKRKSKRKPMVRRKLTLDTVFDCLFCNHEKTIECRLDKDSKVGHLKCKVCDVSFQCNINYLSEPIDVYSEWIDACNEANKPGARAARAHNGGGLEDEEDEDIPRKAVRSDSP